MLMARASVLLSSTALLTTHVGLFAAQSGFATHFSNIFRPIVGEYDIVGKYPAAEHTIKSLGKYESSLEELKSAVAPELELIKSRVLAPTIEYQSVLKVIRKTITKRSHKVQHPLSISSLLTTFISSAH
jgi:amphiphysin